MTTLSSFFKVNLVDDHTADDMNVLIAAALRAEYANTETLSANKTLADSDCQFQILTASGADRSVLLPPESTSNHFFAVLNNGTSNNLIVKDDSATTILATLSRGEWAMFIPFGGVVWKEFMRSGETSTMIDGLQLSWNSATSISVGVGSCYAENGDYIDITSALVKSGLSLSASTWYHIYVYLSSGVPAAEVVTTAPAAWKGKAYSKTSDATRRYVGSIKTDGSGNVLNFVHNPISNLVKYNDTINNGTPYRVLSGGAATTNTAISVSSCIPTTAITVEFMLINNGTVTLLLNNAAGQNFFQVLATLRVLLMSIHESQNIYYSYPAGGGSANVDVSGYVYLR